MPGVTGGRDLLSQERLCLRKVSSVEQMGEINPVGASQALSATHHLKVVWENRQQQNYPRD